MFCFYLQFLKNAVLEAKDVICDIQNSLNEQKQLLAFSARQQQDVCALAFLSIDTKILSSVLSVQWLNLVENVGIASKYGFCKSDFKSNNRFL